MEFVMILSAEIISFYLMCILASGIIYLFIPKSKTVIILVGNMIAGIIFWMRLEIDWSISILLINAITAIFGVGTAKVIRKLVQNLK